MNYLNQLQNHICEVVFTKVNGEERTLKGTLKSDMIPEVKGTGSSSINEEVVKVYDLENDGWRSFKVNSVIGFTIIANDSKSWELIKTSNELASMDF